MVLGKRNGRKRSQFSRFALLGNFPISYGDNSVNNRRTAPASFPVQTWYCVARVRDARIDLSSRNLIRLQSA